MTSEMQPMPTDADCAELDRQWGAIEAGEPTVPHEQVARWLETWGTPAFKRWHRDEARRGSV